MQNTQPTLTCKSFDDQYKRIQSFRNQYLNMIRIVLKSQSNNKFPHLTMDVILMYNEIENKITNINNDIHKFTRNLKQNYNLTSQNQYTNPIFESLTGNNVSRNNTNLNNVSEDDIRMAQTFITFLPFMIYYYNSLSTNAIPSEQPQSVDNFLTDISLD